MKAKGIPKLIALCIVVSMVISGMAVVWGNFTPNKDIPVEEAEIDDSWKDIVYVGNYQFNPFERLPNLSDELSYSSGSGFYLMKMAKDVPAGEWWEVAENAGVHIYSGTAGYKTYVVHMGPNAMDRMLDTGHVEWIGDYHPAYKILTDLSGPGLVDLTIQIFEDYEDETENPARIPVNPTLYKFDEDGVAIPQEKRWEIDTLHTINRRPISSGLLAEDEYRARIESRVRGLSAEPIIWGGDYLTVRVPASTIPRIARIPEVRNIFEPV